MKVSEKTLKWAMRFYPPLFFQGIWVKKFHENFMGVDVKITPSIFNKNYNASIFGGTIYAASDPFYAILFDQNLRSLGYRTKVWLKSASIQYIRPGRSVLSFSIQLTLEDISEAKSILDMEGKFIKSFPLKIYDKSGTLCATVESEIYIRKLNLK